MDDEMANLGNNRNILECKFCGMPNRNGGSSEIIETYWNILKCK